jgi:hypothetical protein
MDEQVEFPVKERLKYTDPREYITETKFIKTASELDPSPDNPWDKVLEVKTGRLLSRNEQITIATGIARQDEEYQLIAFAVSDEMNYSTIIEGLTRGKAEIIAQVVREAAIYLPPEQRGDYVKSIGGKTEQFQEGNLANAAEMCYRELINFLPDVNEEREINLDLADADGQRPSPNQEKQLMNFLLLVSRKLEPDRFDSLAEDFMDNIRWLSGAFTENFNLNFSDIFRLIVARKREAWEEDFWSLDSSPKASRFPVEELVETLVESKEGLKKRLEQMPVKIPPKFNRMTAEATNAEFVDLDKVVGGGYKGGTFLLEEGTRGLNHIYQLCLAIQEGSLDLNSRSPIQVFEYQGEYYVLNDGRHRTSALKALGVSFVPMLVKHFS